jgi:hypothetical protein
MIKFEDIFLLVLLISLICVYVKQNVSKETFEVLFSPYYPISNQINLAFNNFNNNIDDFRLNVLKDVLNRVIRNANDGNENYLEFNYRNSPVVKTNMKVDKLNPLTDFLVESINSNLPKNHFLTLVNLEDIVKLEVDKEVKINFKMICEYKIKTNRTYEYERQKYNIDEKQNNLVLDVEVISLKKGGNEKLHLNYINMIGLSSSYLPGSNYSNLNSYNNFDSLSNSITEDDLPDNSVNDTKYSEINTEEAESFFNI